MQTRDSVHTLPENDDGPWIDIETCSRTFKRIDAPLSDVPIDRRSQKHFNYPFLDLRALHLQAANAPIKERASTDPDSRP